MKWDASGGWSGRPGRAAAGRRSRRGWISRAPVAVAQGVTREGIEAEPARFKYCAVSLAGRAPRGVGVQLWARAGVAGVARSL